MKGESQNRHCFLNSIKWLKKLVKIKKKLTDKGITIVPTLLFTSDSGYAKLEIALAKGKKLYDKRENLKTKDLNREMNRKFK